MESLEDRVRRVVREDVAIVPYDSGWAAMFLVRDRGHPLEGSVSRGTVHLY